MSEKLKRCRGGSIPHENVCRDTDVEKLEAERDALLAESQPDLDITLTDEGEIHIGFMVRRGQMLDVVVSKDGSVSYAYSWDGKKKHARVVPVAEGADG